jgi:hypothetical protein
MVEGHPWPLLLHDNHRATYTPTISGNVYATMMMVDVDANEFAEPPGTTYFAEVRDESGGIAS